MAGTVTLITGTSGVVTVPATGIVDTGTLGLATIANVAGTYTNPTMTLNSNGLVTSISSGALAAVKSIVFNGGATLTGNVVLTQANADWNATSGVAQILNKPSITQAVNADWNVTTTTSPAYIQNKPSTSGSFGYAIYTYFGDTPYYAGGTQNTLSNWSAALGALPTGWTMASNRALTNSSGKSVWVFLTTTIYVRCATTTGIDLETTIYHLQTGDLGYAPVEGEFVKVDNNNNFISLNMSCLLKMDSGDHVFIDLSVSAGTFSILGGTSFGMVFLNP